MTTYYIQTTAGKEGPFSIEDLRKRGINSGTSICNEEGQCAPACQIEALKSVLDEPSVPLYFKRHVGPKYVFSADVITEPKTRSRITFMQWASIILLLMNGALYYYKQNDSKIAKVEVPEKVVKAKITQTASVPVEKLVAKVSEPIVPQADTTNNHIRNNWSSFIKTSHNSFKFYSKLGGIHHLKTSIQNNTGFPLDTVTLAIKYIRRGETYKTEYVTYYNIPEHSEVTLPAPNSRSGTSVELNITAISSEKLNFFYSADTAGTSAL